MPFVERWPLICIVQEKQANCLASSLLQNLLKTKLARRRHLPSAHQARAAGAESVIDCPPRQLPKWPIFPKRARPRPCYAHVHLHLRRSQHCPPLRQPRSPPAIFILPYVAPGSGKTHLVHSMAAVNTYGFAFLHPIRVRTVMNGHRQQLPVLLDNFPTCLV